MNDLTDHQKQIFAERLDVLDDAIPGYSAAFRLLESHMVREYGGKGVVVAPWPYDHLLDLLEAGHVMDGKVRMVKGERSACHTNVARRYVSNKIHAIGTGFGLSDDGLWRDHSWGLTKTGIIVETTVPRTTYFGIVLMGAEARQFCEGVT